MKYAPHECHKTAIRFLVNHPAAGLFQDPGFGKTAEVLKAFTICQKARPHKMLVVAPLRVAYDVWSASGEIGKWDEFKHLKVALLHGSKKESRLEADADIYVTNFESLDWLMRPLTTPSSPSRLDGLIKAGVSTLVIDELSKFKATNTKRFKGMKTHLRKFSRRWGLTGSPAANSLLNLFGECYVLDQGKHLGQYVTHFRNNYFYPTGFQGYEWKPQPGAEARIYAALEGLVISMRATDHLDLPQLVTENRWVDLPPKVREFYDGMEDDMIATIADHTFVAGSAGVVSGKCRQIASGGLYHTIEGQQQQQWLGFVKDTFQRIDPKVSGLQIGSKRIDFADVEHKAARAVQHLHHAKTEALEELVEELQGAPLLVGIEFKHDLDRIREVLGKEIPCIHGGTKPAECSKILEDWNAGKLPILCGHPASMGHGLNMQYGRCSHVAWYTPPWDREMNDQLIARVWRQGNKTDRVFVHYLLARETVDVAVIRALAQKGKIQSALFEALKDYAAGRTTRYPRKKVAAALAEGEG
jgi:SNF2 family DNA or RNA helicase